MHDIIINLKLRMKRSWRTAEKLANAVYTEWVTCEDHLDDLDDLDDIDELGELDDLDPLDDLGDLDEPDELDEGNGLGNVDDLKGLYADEDNRERERSIQGP